MTGQLWEIRPSQPHQPRLVLKSEYDSISSSFCLMLRLDLGTLVARQDETLHVNNAVHKDTSGVAVHGKRDPRKCRVIFNSFTVSQKFAWGALAYE